MSSEAGEWGGWGERMKAKTKQKQTTKQKNAVICKVTALDRAQILRINLPNQCPKREVSKVSQWTQETLWQDNCHTDHPHPHNLITLLDNLQLKGITSLKQS